MARSKKGKKQSNPAADNFDQGFAMISAMPMFSGMLGRAIYHQINRQKGNRCPESGWAIITRNGEIHVHPTRRGSPENWVYVLAHCLLHLAFDHFREQADDPTFLLWNMACDIYIARFLGQLKIGKPPADIDYDINALPTSSEEAIFRQLYSKNEYPEGWRYCGTTGPSGADMIMDELITSRWHQLPDWPALFGQGVSLAVKKAVAETSHVALDRDGNLLDMSVAEQARQWFIASYPLLGALAAGFKIIEDARVCQNMSISVAAVHAELQEIYINPAAGLTEDEMRFVMAHELLHVGLRHDTRIQGRDPYLWTLGALYDEELKGLSAEEIYFRITTDLRKYRRLVTLRGKGLGDILPPSQPEWWRLGEGVKLDDFYRSRLMQGLEYHQDQGRGFIPAGLIEEIRALSHPPIPWDVELASWFDLPRWYVPEELLEGRTFGVILDSSGSMDRLLLAKALGAIASYAAARDVPLVRVVFCDATYYDQGYMPPETIADRVQVRGRGGTILQPAINFLERAEDFPKDGPLLIITDGYCDKLTIRAARPHAYLLPRGNTLPFRPHGELFYIE